jgi:hypothetical protein
LYCRQAQGDGLGWPQARIGGWRVSFRYAFPVLRTTVRSCASALGEGPAVAFGARQRKKIMDLAGWA